MPPPHEGVTVAPSLRRESDVTDVARKYKGFTLCADAIPGVEVCAHEFFMIPLRMALTPILPNDTRARDQHDGFLRRQKYSAAGECMIQRHCV